MTKVKNKISSIKTTHAFITGGAWSTALLRVLNNAFDNPMKPEEKASIPFAGGIMQNGYQCGMIWGATLAAGAQAYKLLGPGPQAEAKAIIAAQKLVESFRAYKNTIDCIDITEIDKSSSTMQMITYFLIKGGTIGCVRMAAKYAPLAFNDINTAQSEKDVEAPPAPVSCAAMLAQKMGASDMHTVMAAGFAGGIGLYGGACGALGAALWIHSLNSIKEEDSKIDAAGLVKVATFVREGVLYLAEREEPLNFTGTAREKKPSGLPAAPQGSRKVSTGTMPDFAFAGEGVRIASFAQNSPADKAGLKKGDIIIQLGEHKVKNLREYSNALKSFQPGDKVDLVYLRKGETQSTKITLEER